VVTDVIQSLIRCSWAMSLFGVRQTFEVLSALGKAQSPRPATDAFEAVSGAVEEHLGGTFGDAYRTGNRWQSDLIEAVFNFADPAVGLSTSVASQTLLRGSLIMLRQSAQILQATMPSGSRLIWQELQNKLEAFESFQYVDRILGFGKLEDADLSRLAGEAGRSGPYLKLWLTEGLGFAFAEAAWGDGEPEGLLRHSTLDQLPEESLIPLHTGMGLSLARHLLPDLSSGDPALVEAALERLWRWCERNAREGFALACFEALGLIVRQLIPEAAAEIDAALSWKGEDTDRREAFWHGLGRGLYFTATQALPGSTGRAVDKARREAPDRLARRNALSGLAWAVTLVNFRQPEILEALLRSRDFDAEECSAVSAGIASASLLWLDSAGEESQWRGFRRHRPAAEAVERWQRMVSGPCDAAIEGWDAVKAGPGPGSIFHYPQG